MVSDFHGFGVVVMTKYQPLIDYYYKAARILRDRLPDIPALQLTEGKTYYGSYRKKDGVSSISLSIKTCWPIDHDELIDTISHELAHSIFYEHGKPHETVTNHFVNILNQHWECELVH